MTESKTYIKTILSAVYLALGPEEFAAVSGGDTVYGIIGSREEALRNLKNVADLSVNQRVALFSYVYLYTKLTEGNPASLAPIQSALGVLPGVVKNLSLLITPERLEYINGYYQKSNKPLSMIFAEPEDFITRLVEDVTVAKAQEEKRPLRGLQAKEYEHPADKSAIAALESQAGWSALVKLFNEYTVEKMTAVQNTGSYFLVTERNLPYVYHAMQEVCKVLDIRKAPLLYIQNGGLNAYTIGTKNPIIVLGSACLSLLEHDELLFILGHETGHIKSGHFLYRRMTELGQSVLHKITKAVPALSLIEDGIHYTLMDWYRKSELTADRAGLLACQSMDAALTLFTKMAGFPMKYYNAINKEDILEQARTFEDLDNSAVGTLAKAAGILNAFHPWTVLRAKELDQWFSSGRYQRIFNTHARPSAERRIADQGTAVRFIGTDSK